MLLNEINFHERLQNAGVSFQPVVQFDPSREKIIAVDFSENNKDLNNIDLSDIKTFCNYVDQLLKINDAKFGFGGYDEVRDLYARSTLFGEITGDDAEVTEPRRLHLGIDIWGDEGTEIFAPLDGFIHSFAFNNNFGDYGSTIILQHKLTELTFYTLYGHLSLRDLQNLKKGDAIKSGGRFAHFGNTLENGYWPPHLHFQLIISLLDKKGDYPGVCKVSERQKYLNNSPDPDIILNLKKFIFC